MFTCFGLQLLAIIFSLVVASDVAVWGYIVFMNTRGLHELEYPAFSYLPVFTVDTELKGKLGGSHICFYFEGIQVPC